jgi:hypothetical protein
MTALHALPGGPRGRLLALGLALLMVLVLWAGAVAPVLGWYDSRQDDLRRQQAIGRRMAALVQTLPALRAEADAAAARGAARHEALLDGATDSVAAAALQQRLDEMAGQAGLRIGSAEVMPSEAAGAFRAIAVRATVTAPWPALVRLLRAIAAADTPLLVDDLQARGPPRNSRDSDPPIDVTFTVIGYRAGGPPGAGEAPAP